MEVLIVGSVIGIGALISKLNENKAKVTNKNDALQGLLSNGKMDKYMIQNMKDQNLYLNKGNPRDTNKLHLQENFTSNKSQENFEANDKSQYLSTDLNRIDNEIVSERNLEIGNDIHRKSFEHNNMVPFFGSNLKQNMNPTHGRTLFNYQNGSDDHYQQKKEVGLFFEPKKNVGNVYGHQNANINLNDRFRVSNYRNNETPIEKIQVGPGLNKGFTAMPSGGFHQGDSRDYILPKKVNETRTLNNPKVTYKGRILSGKKISKRGVTTDVHKRQPERYYKNEPNKYFTTTGDHLGHTQYPLQLLKNTNRKTTILEKRLGPATHANGNQDTVRSKVKKPFKSQLFNDGPRNATCHEEWSISENNGDNNGVEHFTQYQKQPNIRHNNGRNDDYGKKSFINNKTIRCVTGLKSVVLNKKSNADIGEARNGQEPRFTKKQNFVGNNGVGLKVNSIYSKQQYHDPHDIARTTIKETTENNNYNGNLGPQRPENNVYHQPGDRAKTTTRETTMVHDVLGNINIQEGNANNSSYKNVHDNLVACTTNREMTSVDYTGNAEGNMGQTQGGYQVTDATAKGTKRQYLADIDYTGNVGNAEGINKPMSYADIYNATIKSIRNDLEKNRIPSTEGAKKMNNNINYLTNKDMKNAYDNRVTIPNKHNEVSLNTINPSMKIKNTLNDKSLGDRNNPSILSAFKNNPFSKPLNVSV